MGKQSPNTQKQRVSRKCNFLISQKFAGLSILTSKISDSYLKDCLFHRKIYKMTPHAGLQDTECELGHMTSPNLLNDIISLTYRHRPSFKSLWQVGLETALCKGQTRWQILRNLVCILLIIGSNFWCTLQELGMILQPKWFYEEYQNLAEIFSENLENRGFLVYHPSNNGLVIGH